MWIGVFRGELGLCRFRPCKFPSSDLAGPCFGVTMPSRLRPSLLATATSSPSSSASRSMPCVSCLSTVSEDDVDATLRDAGDATSACPAGTIRPLSEIRPSGSMSLRSVCADVRISTFLAAPGSNVEVAIRSSKEGDCGSGGIAAETPKDDERDVKDGYGRPPVGNLRRGVFTGDIGEERL
jgi:hypothetical protein